MEGLAEPQAGSLRKIDLARTTGSSSMTSSRNHETWGNGDVRPSSPQLGKEHISCQLRSTSSRFQSRANSKMRRYIRSNQEGIIFNLQGSIFQVRAGVCQC